MARITQNGLKLTKKLNPSIGDTRQIAETCSLICRHAKTYCRIQELWCNGFGDHGISESQDKWLTTRETQIEKRLADLVADLPTVNGEPIRLNLNGDPRGATVKLVMPDGRYDSWGGAEDGLCVPGS